MSISPLITFKAGACELDTSVFPHKVIPRPTPGYLYLYEEDELINFCWRPRSAPMSEPELKLVMIPADGQFTAYNHKKHDPTGRSYTNGRIFVLKFESSTQRHLFWLQSKSQDPKGDPSFFSQRDLKIGWMVDRILQGEQVNVRQEVAEMGNEQGGDGDDEEMEDTEPKTGGDIPGNIGSGDPFMGDPENEGEGPREGGADGGRAAGGSSDAATAVQNFLRSMQGNHALTDQSQQPQNSIFTTLPDLLPSSTTIPVIDSADTSFIDNLLTHIPPVLLLLNQESNDLPSVNPNLVSAKAAIEALSLDQKKDILRKVLRSPQFSQSLASLTAALRDGGLPVISEALHIPVKDSGYLRQGGGVPLGNGDAVEAFMNGVKKSAEEDGKADDGKMETD